MWCRLPPPRLEYGSAGSSTAQWLCVAGALAMLSSRHGSCVVCGTGWAALRYTNLGGWVRHVDLTQDGMAVVRQHNACMRVCARVRACAHYESLTPLALITPSAITVGNAHAHPSCQHCGRAAPAAPPLGSSNILSIERGPSVVRIMSATACAAAHNVMHPGVRGANQAMRRAHN